MKFLSIAGTAAMFLVGGGFVVHGIPPLHHAVESLVHPLLEMESVGPLLGGVAEMLLDALVGLIGGSIVMGIGRIRGAKANPVEPSH